jgi:DNA adenine methylase
MSDPFELVKKEEESGMELFDRAGLNLAFKNPCTQKSLLRYPGGKTRGIETIIKHFPAKITSMCSPFFGGGSVELYMAASGIKVYGYDLFKPLVEFWQCVIRDPNQLASLVAEYHPLSRKTFYELQTDQIKLKSKLARAAVYYVLNRSSFSGSTLSGGMSPEHPRFTLSSIQRLKDFSNPNFSVSRADFEESILLHKDIFTYLDPPYWIGSALYGKKGSTHRGFDHHKLFALLKRRKNWILSYNDCKEIRHLYSKFETVTPVWKYGMPTNKESKEILIFSPDLHPSTQLSPVRLPSMSILGSSKASRNTVKG